MKIGIPNLAVTCNMNGVIMEHVSDANGNFVINTCGSVKTVTLKAAGHCETTFEVPTNSNEISVTLKASGCKSISSTCHMDYP